METKVNQAQIKRDRQATESFNIKLRRDLRSFENMFLNGSVDYAFRMIRNKITVANKAIADFPTRVETRHNKYLDIKHYQNVIAKAELELTFNGIITLNAIAPAKKAYDERIEKLVSQLVAEGFGDRRYTCETINTAGGQLEFLFSNDIKSLHARFIYVSGTMVADHFRFITTVRMNKDVVAPVEVIGLPKDLKQTPSVAKVGSRGEQVAACVAKQMNAKQIATELEMNISYVRRLMAS